jgi:hypothetical protein
MSLILTFLLLVIFIAIVASLYPEGMWGNAIMLINVVTAGLLATGYFEPLASFLESKAPTYTYLWDFLAVWAIFVLSLILLRIATDKICRVKVRFLGLANQIGSVVFACLVAMVMVCFTTFTLHTAPLGKEFMWGGFKANEGKVFAWAPDKWWITFAMYTSGNAYSWPTVNKFDGKNVPEQYITNYEARRQEIENHVKTNHAIRKKT